MDTYMCYSKTGMSVKRVVSDAAGLKTVFIFTINDTYNQYPV